ncbi:WGxxGxxG family protein [Streptomyces litchfieldiae]|uniref:WGxxGxxG family protein n=1 Tax=Streptomyces litchfieldiae TaxID=3075543 RepID=A0ABU2MJJ3_9ACTN|nr:WGxxGxxG family protein [Streptomyces sp. DSM 44938]MDT0341533.1 WGxxGxxG family protein [Streptomyces sp. DSM 44938]
MRKIAATLTAALVLALAPVASATAEPAAGPATAEWSVSAAAPEQENPRQYDDGEDDGGGSGGLWGLLGLLGLLGLIPRKHRHRGMADAGARGQGGAM